MATIPLVLLDSAAKTLLLVASAAATALGGVLVSKELEESAQTEEGIRDKARAMPQAPTRRACDKCPPDCGTVVSRNWNMSDDAREYQARITAFAPGTEWNFAGVDFDGFRSEGCLLQEAKAKYDQFFDEGTGHPKFFFSVTGVKKIAMQARSQSTIALAYPPSCLHWYFMQPLSYAYFAKTFRAIAPNIHTNYHA